MEPVETIKKGVELESSYDEREPHIPISRSQPGKLEKAQAVVQRLGDAREPQQQAAVMDSPPLKINLISCEPMAHVSDIKLIRTDTTLDLSQKAEKVSERIDLDNGTLACFSASEKCQLSKKDLCSNMGMQESKPTFGVSLEPILCPCVPLLTPLNINMLRLAEFITAE
ncbi:UNVERIFIED_CONTAM: hypothetical protein Scaly_0946600 [Sesamum calycinum]|uniref:Uncharacterized protein n=1 Tax=Sesamum calycinum TaxID=2727403 RepID=A0AAW2QX76_9LAMI